MKLKILKNLYQVVKLKPSAPLPTNFASEEFYSVTKTDDELSIVTENDIEFIEANRERNWNVIKIEGILEFSMIGILARISSILADKNISIFVISTYNTDYILIKEDKFSEAIEILTLNGYELESELLKIHDC